MCLVEKKTDFAKFSSVNNLYNARVAVNETLCVCVCVCVVAIYSFMFVCVGQEW